MITDRVVALYRYQKVRRYQSCTLMQKLEERVLTIGAGFTPEHWPGSVIIDRVTITTHRFAVTLHVELL